MRYTLLLFILMVSACSVNTIYDLDSARQVAVNATLEDDTYIQYDGYNFTELIAEKSSCDTCYDFAYTFSINEAHLPGIKGYVAEVSVKDNIITTIKYTEIPLTTTESYTTESNDAYHSIPDRFDEFCENKCGDGICNDIVCQDSGCICEESTKNCPEDC